MKRTSMALIAGPLLLLGGEGHAAGRPSAINDKLMLKFDLETRIEQRCDARARGEISRSHAGFSPDKVIAYAFSQPVTHGTEVIAPGAIFRAKGRWYRLSFRCTTTPDGLGIVNFQHTLGPEVPGWDMSQVDYGN